MEQDAVPSVRLFARRPAALRLDVLPFLLAYALLYAVYFTLPRLASPATYAAPAVLAVHLLTFLVTHWSLSARCLLQLRRVSSLDAATLAHASLASARPELCPLVRRARFGAAAGEAPEVRFEFRKRTYLLEGEAAVRELPMAHDLPLGAYTAARGLRGEALARAEYTYSRNVYEIPQRTFADLLREHALAPFFLFQGTLFRARTLHVLACRGVQVLCVALWSLDDYWYYSVFTLLMLVVFECTVVKSRLRNLEEMRSLATPASSVLVLRDGSWRSLSSEQLLPADLVALRRAPSSPYGEALESVCPADVVLLHGSVTVNESALTGESTPLLKESLASLGLPPSDTLCLRRHRAAVVLGGTKLLQHTTAAAATFPPPPGGGAVGFVLRTGFSSSQGALIRTILFSSERVSENSRETLVFILFLLAFALLAAAHVLAEGLADPSVDRFKLFLHTSMIITSVVPPELPMELSLAVNHSLLALHTLGIYCTEPFRIPLAGKLATCCFDKTGTLTSDELIVHGVAGLPSPRGCSEELAPAHALPAETCLVLAGCHQLLHLDGQLVGDPMEKAALHAVGWTYSADGVCRCHLAGRRSTLLIKRRFPFSSDLKRSSTIVELPERHADALPAGLRLLTKGAPETVRALLREVPAGYDAAYTRHTRRGARVIALAGKPLDAAAAAAVRSLPRDEAEAQLDFLGFLVLHNPLKPESAAVLAALRASSHQLMMITGDQMLTACHAARELRLLTRPARLLEVRGDGELRWAPLHADEGGEAVRAELSGGAARRLSAGFDLCVAGEALAAVGDSLAPVLPHVRVLARMAPEQKQQAIALLRGQGIVCLMCGDGTNDVGALRQSDVGVALVSTSLVVPPPSRLQETVLTDARGGGGGVRHRKPKGGQKAESSAERSQRRLEEMQQEMAQLPMVKLGDASIAAAFTARSASVAGCLDVISQGRCTLVTTVQMFKILALNCLVSAYSLSVLHLEGVRLGDTQATLTGLLNAALFLFVSFAKPLPRLAPHTPPSVLSPYVFCTITCQFAVHLYVLVQAIESSREGHAVSPLDRYTDFEPTVPNTVVWLVSVAMLITNFAVNYKGKPFMEALSANKGLMGTLVGSAVIAVALVGGALPDLYTYLELAPLPNEDLRSNLMGLMGLDFLLCLLIEKALSKLFHF
ncbi:hypothetical protein AB1Y20_015125 [Prymnesium parvum]|uniref:Cation-transporting ATPase n=1 Tax=Prymnesium parvum TaxID=97485 RepID=A0AB34JW51_PRYPA